MVFELGFVDGNGLFYQLLDLVHMQFIKYGD